MLEFNKIVLYSLQGIVIILWVYLSAIYAIQKYKRNNKK